MTSLQDPIVTATNLPVITSSVKQVEVISATVDEVRQLNITVLNNSQKGIKALAVSSGNYRLILDDGLISDNPETIIQSRASYTIAIPVDNLKSTVPVMISGVIYDDDTNGGKEDEVNRIRDARREQKVKRLSKPDNKGERQ